METIIDIKNWVSDEVIYSYKCKDNTIKKTVRKAVKQGISLAYADLSVTDLSFINLKNADLNHANLFKANLSGTNLSNADLSHAYLNNVNLYGTNLSYADLSHAYLNNIDFLDTSFLKDVKGLNDQCPKTGSFIGWKKCFDYGYNGSYIVKLEIPADARRSSSTGIKCRCDKAKVLEIQNIDGSKSHINKVYSRFDSRFSYEINETVEEFDFDERYWVECAPGIRFFMNREDAVNY